MTELTAKYVLTADTGQARKALTDVSATVEDLRGKSAAASTDLDGMTQSARAVGVGLGEAGSAATGLGQAAREAQRGIAEQARATDQASDALDRHQRAATGGIASLARLRGMALAAAPAIAAVFSVGALSGVADNWSDMQSRLGASIKDMEAAPALMADMLRLANASYSSIGQTVETFAGNVGAMRELGYSTEQTVDFTESLNHALVITATKGQQAASVQYALSKAMATGKLQADGLETVLANGGRVAEALAAELGVGVSQLRDLASQGKITGRVIADALLKSLEDVRAEAGDMPTTISDGFLKIRNATGALIGSIDQQFGASAAVAGWLDGISKGVERLALADFSGLLGGIGSAAELAGQALMILAATRIPALIAAIASLNISTIAMAAQFAAGAVASRAIAVAMAAQAVAARGLGAAMAFAGGPVGLLAGGIAALGLAFYNQRNRAREFAEAIETLQDISATYDSAMSDFHRNRTAESAERLHQLAQERVAAAEAALAAVRQQREDMVMYNPIEGAAWLAGRETDRMRAFNDQVAAAEMAVFDAVSALGYMEHAVGNVTRETETAAAATDRLSEAQSRAADAAMQMQRSFEQRAALASAEAAWGAESIGYQIVQLAHEREIIAARIDSLDVSEEIKQSIYDAADAALVAENATMNWDHAVSILLGTTQDTLAALDAVAAAEPPANWLEGAIGQAERLASALWAGIGAVGAAADDKSVIPDKPKVTVPRAPRRAAGGGGRARSGGGRAGGGRDSGADKAAREAERQRKAVTDLIDSLELELEVMRASDPVMEEMLRARETLSHATAAERAAVEELIRSREREKTASEEAAALARETEQLGRDAIGGILSQMRDGASAGEVLVGVLGRVASKLSDIAADNLSSILFGKGSAGGGWLGGVLDGVRGLKPNALGDVIGAPTLFAYGDQPGQLGVMGEAGAEAIMPLTHAMGGGVGARVAGRETTLPLTRLASGKLGVSLPDMMAPIRAFASGGAFGLIPSPPPALAGTGAPAGGGDMRLHMSFDLRGAEGDEAIERKIQRAMTAGREQLLKTLPDQVKVILSDPRARR